LVCHVYFRPPDATWQRNLGWAERAFFAVPMTKQAHGSLMVCDETRRGRFFCFKSFPTPRQIDVSIDFVTDDEPEAVEMRHGWIRTVNGLKTSLRCRARICQAREKVARFNKRRGNQWPTAPGSDVPILGFRAFIPKRAGRRKCAPIRWRVKRRVRSREKIFPKRERRRQRASVACVASVAVGKINFFFFPPSLKCVFQN